MANKTSERRKARYAAQPARADANKKRKVLKQARLYPNDKQAATQAAAFTK